MANFWGGCTPPRHSGTWVGARVASLRCHYPPPRRSQYSRNAEDRPHQSKTSCRGGHRRGTTTSGPGRGPLAGFAVTFYGRFSGDRRGQWLCPLQAQHVACGVIEFLLARHRVDSEQVIDQLHNARGDRVAGVELGRVEELPPQMRQAAGMHQLRPAHVSVNDIAIGLQYSFELSQKLLRPFPSAPHAELEHYPASRPAVLPEIRLMILPSPIV